MYSKEEGKELRMECWPFVYKFFYTNMMKLESFFMEYKDLLKYGSEP